MKKLFSILALITTFSCETEKQTADLIVTNAMVYTVDDAFSTKEAFAIKDGKFVAVGTSEDITSSYQSDNMIDANGQAITPGLIDAHCHFLNLGIGIQ